MAERTTVFFVGGPAAGHVEERALPLPVTRDIVAVINEHQHTQIVRYALDTIIICGYPHYVYVDAALTRPEKHTAILAALAAGRAVMA